jgi:hypothetical protein
MAALSLAGAATLPEGLQELAGASITLGLQIWLLARLAAACQ